MRALHAPYRASARDRCLRGPHVGPAAAAELSELHGIRFDSITDSMDGGAALHGTDVVARESRRPLVAPSGAAAEPLTSTVGIRLHLFGNRARGRHELHP